MPQGTVTINVKDGGIGLVGGANPNAVVVLGVCSKTNANTLYSFSQPSDVVAAVGYGPGADAVCYQLSAAGGSCYFMPIEATVPGTITEGTATNGASTSTGTISFGATLPYDCFNLVVAVVSTGGAVDALVAGGNIGVQVSLDGGTNWGRTVLVPSTGILPLTAAFGAVKGDTGLVATLDTGKFNVGDSIPATCVAPFYGATQLGTAFDALLADSRTWGLVSVVGYAATSAGTEALSSTITTKMNAAAIAYRYARAELSCPIVVGETDATRIASFASVDDTRQAVAGGTGFITSPVLGANLERGMGIAIIARLSSIAASRSPGVPDDGPLIGVVSITRDERVTPGLFNAGFDTVNTIIGRGGVYTSIGQIHVHSGSDYSIWPYARVIDLVSNGALQGAMHFLNTAIKVNASDGTIDALDASNIQKYIKGKVMALAGGDVSAVNVQVVTTDNILATQTLTVNITVTPFGYAQSVVVNIAYVNPALQLAA